MANAKRGEQQQRYGKVKCIARPKLNPPRAHQGYNGNCHKENGNEQYPYRPTWLTTGEAPEDCGEDRAEQKKAASVESRKMPGKRIGDVLVEKISWDVV